MELEVIFREAKHIGDLEARPYSGFNPGTTILTKGTVVSEGGLPLPCDILWERDVAIKLRDGTVIYTDIFRPVGITSVPAIIAWMPGKSLPHRLPVGVSASVL